MISILRTAIVVSILHYFMLTGAYAFDFKDNFDSYNSIANLSTNWDYVSPGITLDPTGGYNNSKAVMFNYSGSNSYPLEKIITNAGLDHVYVRLHLKVNSNPIGGIKFLKIFGVQSGSNYANWTWNFSPFDVSPLPSNLTVLCFGNGASLSNDTGVCVTPTGAISGVTSYSSFTYSGSYVLPNPGQWYTVETYNRYSTDNNSDGEMWMKVDGKEILHLTGVVNRNNSNSRVIHNINFGDYSNPYANMTLWLDDIEISDTPPSPNAPAGLTATVQKP